MRGKGWVLGNLFKGEATKQLVRERVHPSQGQKGEKHRVPACFARKWWTVFLDSEDDLVRTIRYVEKNPVKAGFAPQKWRFVKPYPAEALNEPLDTDV